MKIGYCWNCGELKLRHEYLACRLNEHRAAPVLVNESSELWANELELPQIPLVPKTKRISKSDIYQFLREKLDVDVEWRTLKKVMKVILLEKMREGAPAPSSAEKPRENTRRGE